MICQRESQRNERYQVAGKAGLLNESLYVEIDFLSAFQLQNIASERDERKGTSNDFISLTSQFLFIVVLIKDERATQKLWEVTLKE